MRLLLQRVSQAQVVVDQKEVGSIEKGVLLFLGIHRDDTLKGIPRLIERVLNLRIFDERSLKDIKGELLIVSQFTLYADCRKGRRPSYTQAMPSSEAEEIYTQFVREARLQHEGKVATGEFGADMQVDLVNDGPVTLFIPE